MLPVLFSLGPIPISSFGLFLSLGFIYGSFLVWRLSRAWELNEEKILDLIILTFFGGLIGARIFFVLLNFQFFQIDLFKIVLITKYPGISFWGGFLGGWLTLFIFAKRLKFNFLQVADIAAVGFIGALILGDLGCFLGGCGIGRMSSIFLAVPMVGVLGKRFPVQIMEAFFLSVLLLKMWPKATHFHIHGKVLSLTLIYLGLIKFISEFFLALHMGGYFLSAFTSFLGIFFYYQVTKRSIKGDLISAYLNLGLLFTSRGKWNRILAAVHKNWYNFKVKWSLRVKSLSRFLRRARVKLTPKDI
ncbi:hypothetical protein A3F00_02600 [Candidatus Daviesbacteria bacterium RIFCSPHIGHO2_12_FULL_37_11]|uniref:Phosphatidylglycerol--prolipoprotein diacylglyceryl transferase n=1 Tax=Candidatus Daviesbacteria bacterium RIFCSPHIGHO2_12_FULL_37_11 TaxID=1797777 RepID=A0A1F5KEX0_9BACT|nr:MAG: hypothetical protein A2769_00470 [Candidatus Daviesbacteria bacterium RIFCSPHIGHO2_01_FULL_37_27]OGE39325.1 MAG: hypothetical protein A3F00_02600 [Candidatus Daviesbacteria bacterium RIFCSPHIGHO2_12_FULL_37_11]OGE45367.1 MAG: hypothetical protein A3B39_03020 [Candidatus Daviesbacteria bacterium RIFCSPLOWO2_01_FULL_37_10]